MSPGTDSEVVTVCKIERPSPGILRLTKSRSKAALHVGFTVLFFAGWYAFLLAGKGASDDSPKLFMLLFWLVPLFAVPELVRQMRVIGSGETFTLNRKTGLIQRNEVQLARFSDVDRVQIRVISDSDGGDEYRLSIVLKSEDKIRIGQSSNAEDLTAIAEDLADMLGVEVGRKGGSRRLSLGSGRD